MAAKLPSFDFGKIRDFFSFGSKNFLGIDIGTFSIRAVEITKRKGYFHLSNYGELESSSFKRKNFQLFHRSAISLSNKEIAQGIRYILEETSIQTKEVSFAIPDFASFFTSFEIPVMDRDEIPQAIQYEIRPYVPLPVNELALDWAIIEGQPSSTPLKVLVVAIPNDVVVQYQEIAQLAELELKTLESEVFALTRALKNSLKGRDDVKKVLGLIDIGSRSATCSIIDGGILKSSHSFSTGGNELTEIVAKSLNIEYNKGEEIKIKRGIAPNQEEKVRKILAPLVDSLLAETKEAFRTFFIKEGKEVEKVFLTGGSATMPGLREYCSASLGKPVEILNPFSNIAYPKIISEIITRMAPSFAIAAGLALKGFEK